MGLIEFLRLIRSIVKIPAIDDEAALRNFLKNAVEAFSMLAAYTPTKADDLTAVALRTVVNNDEVWAAFYRLIKFASGVDDVPLIASATGIDQDKILELRDAIYDQANSETLAANPSHLSGFGAGVPERMG